MASPFGVITLSLLLLIVLLTASCCAGRNFIVGSGRDGWTTNFAEPQDHFQINDTLVFRYDKAMDAVLRVTKNHHDACNTTQPLLRLDGGESRFVLNSSGASSYYFISADARSCRDNGERLAVFVLHRHNNTLSPPKSASPSTALPPAPGNAPSPLQPPPPPPPPKSASTSSTPHPARPKPASPAPVPSPAAQSVLPPSSAPPYPPSAGNASSPSPAPLTTAPAPGTKNGTSARSTSSSAVALRAGVLACLLLGASAAIL